MSDMGDDFRAMKEESQLRRGSHRQQSPKALEAADIQFEVKNYGAHLIVEGPEGYIDFWPGTGRWTVRKGATSFGVKKLIRYIERARLTPENSRVKK